MAVRRRVAGLVVIAALLSTAGPSTAAGNLAQADPSVNLHPVAQLVASDGFAGDGFGHDVDIDGDVMVVGAIGAAYVFTRSDGKWSETAKLTVPDEPSLGSWVALDRDVIAVGAAGAVYVFARGDGGWVETAKLSVPDEPSLGSWVALDRDVIAVGAANAVYVFESSEEGWFSEHLVPSEGLADGPFSSGGDIDDDVIVVAGRWLLHVFVRSDQGWSEAAELLPFDHAVGFDGEVAVDGDVIVAGTYGFVLALPPAPNRAADMYVKPSSGWIDAIPPVGLMATAGVPGDKFGVSTAIDADVIALGVVGGRPIPCEAQESVYVYAKPPSGWADAVLVTRIQASDVGIPPDRQYGYFGGSVALDEGWLAVGASSVTIGLNPGQGAVYLFDLADVIAPLDQESSGGVHRAYWGLLGVAGLVLFVAALAFYARRTRCTAAADDNL
ncbi:MAG: FG-GAP repeat protein [bacterium]|nr:FG-GAP repeat protein [bacterium]